MNDEFEKWFASISEKELNSRSVHQNMLHAWQMSRMLLPITKNNMGAELLPCGHSVDSLGGFGGTNPNGSCMECEADA